MRLAHELSEYDIHGARKGYLAHGKVCLNCGLKSRTAIKLLKTVTVSNCLLMIQNVGFWTLSNSLRSFKQFEPVSNNFE